MSKRRPRASRFRLDGPVPAAAELLAIERLREFAGSPLDPATSRGTLTAQVALGAAAQERSAARLVAIRDQHGRREFRRRTAGDGPEGRGGEPARHAPTIRAIRSGATSRSTACRRRSIIASRAAMPMPRSACRRRSTTARAQGSASISAASSAARCRSRSTAVCRLDGGDSRFAVEADLTQARIDKLLPGWVKPAGVPARATFIVDQRHAQSTRFEDMVIEGPGTLGQGHGRDRRVRRSRCRRISRSSACPTATRPRCKAERGPTARCA